MDGTDKSRASHYTSTACECVLKLHEQDKCCVSGKVKEEASYFSVWCLKSGSHKEHSTHTFSVWEFAVMTIGPTQVICLCNQFYKQETAEPTFALYL